MRAPILAALFLAACGDAAPPGFSTGPAITSVSTSTNGSSTGADTTSTGPAGDSAGESEAELGTCGNGILEADEECDDGNERDLDGCPTNCMPAVCGDGFLREGVEECDDGNADDEDACLSSCVLATCGDGVIRSDAEECDDANDDDTDACTSLCRVALCGDGILHKGKEACDESGNTAACDGDCTLPECGDGIANLQAGEECDDGNAFSLDNCYPSCKAPTMLVFVTSQRYHGDLGGVGGADLKCQKLAESAGLAGTFKAWLWTHESGPFETFYPSPGRYIRPDKVVVALNFEQLFNGPLLAPLTITETKKDVKTYDNDLFDNTGGFWSGGEPLCSAPHPGLEQGVCLNWTSASGYHMGVATTLYGPVIGNYECRGATLLDCNSWRLPLLCVQQAWYSKPG